MGVTRQSETNAMHLSIKDWSLWQEIKNKAEGCETIKVTNPEDKTVLDKYGYKYESLVGRVVHLAEYKREWKGKVFSGFKLHVQDGADKFILDMPYTSRILRNFLHTCPNMNWSKPLSIRAFKGKNDKGEPEQAIWFQQDEQTVKFYFTKDNPHGMPAPKQHPRTQKWDFSEQQEWLIERMMNDTAPAIAAAAAKFAPPIAKADESIQEPDPDDEGIHEEAPEPPTQPRRQPPGTKAPTDPPEIAALILRASLRDDSRERVESELCDQLRALRPDPEQGQKLVLARWEEAVEEAKDDDDILRRLYAIVQREKQTK
jgi:hypothetical protein